MQLLVLDQREFAQLLAVGPHIETALVEISDERRPSGAVTRSSAIPVTCAGNRRTRSPWGAGSPPTMLTDTP
jgi:hypothetical protein